GTVGPLAGISPPSETIWSLDKRPRPPHVLSAKPADRASFLLWTRSSNDTPGLSLTLLNLTLCLCRGALPVAQVAGNGFVDFGHRDAGAPELARVHHAIRPRRLRGHVHELILVLEEHE